jgi:hypothetical protein
MTKPTSKQLRKALDAYGGLHGFPSYEKGGQWSLRYDYNECAIVERAARSYLALMEGPTDEQVEAAMHALIGLGWSADLYPTNSGNWRERARIVVQAALRAEEPE